MPRTKTPAAARTTKPARNKNGTPPPATDVLTLAEAAAYLRVTTDDVLSLVSTQGLPGRQVGAEWRFFKTALQQWLSSAQPESRKQAFWAHQFGALKDDPYLEEMLADIYRQRGRPETEQRD